MFGLKKKEEVFFNLFIETIEKGSEAGEMLKSLMEDYTDIAAKTEALKKIENECDSKVHKIMRALSASFITPFEREDIYYIAKELDNIVDTIEEAASRFLIFNVKDVKEDAVVMSKLIVDCVNELKKLIGELKNMKKSKTLREHIIEVNRIENEGDVAFRRAMEKLFTEETNAIEVIKWKEIYEFLENSMDACENVANTLEGVVMKNA
jgi:predicted phosphate transport protein (TIGR00153 family)